MREPAAASSIVMMGGKGWYVKWRTYDLWKEGEEEKSANAMSVIDVAAIIFSRWTAAQENIKAKKRAKLEPKPQKPRDKKKDIDSAED